MEVNEGKREADALREAQAIREAREADGVRDTPPPPPEKYEPPMTLMVPFIVFGVVGWVLFGWGIGDKKSGMTAVHELFDESFGTLLSWTPATSGALQTSVAYALQVDLRKRRFFVVAILIWLSLSAAYGYCFASISLRAHSQASEWQRLPFPVNAAEETIKATYDIAYCVAVSRETCEEMSVEEATPLFNLSEWTKSTSYERVNALCDANPGNDLAVCKSCEAVKDNAKSEGKVSRYAVKKGRYDEGVKWCGLYFGATNVSAQDQSSSPYMYRRTWLLKRLAKNAMDYVIFDVILGVSASLMALAVCLFIVQNWWRSMKDRKERKGATDGYVQHVEA